MRVLESKKVNPEIKMILEVAILNVKKGLESEFEADFRKASQHISAINGYLNHTLKKCLELRNQYILLVEWNVLEDHTIGFKQSEHYQHWRALLHHYYEPHPTVEHYTTVFEMRSDPHK